MSCLNPVTKWRIFCSRERSCLPVRVAADQGSGRWCWGVTRGGDTDRRLRWCPYVQFPGGGWYVLTRGVWTRCSAACGFPSERSAFPAGKKSWSTKHLLGIRVCRVALPSPPQPEGSTEARPHWWGFSSPQELYWQLSKEWEKTSFTESPLEYLCLLWICLECGYQWFYSWIHCGTKPGIVFCVKLINAQKIWTWDWLLSSKKKIQYRNIKRNYPVQTSLYSGNCYSVP